MDCVASVFTSSLRTNHSGNRTLPVELTTQRGADMRPFGVQITEHKWPRAAQVVALFMKHLHLIVVGVAPRLRHHPDKGWS